MSMFSMSNIDLLWMQPRTSEEQAKAEARLLKRQKEKQRKLEQAGIKYDFSQIAYVCDFYYY
jgi:hypothetical protein